MASDYQIRLCDISSTRWRRGERTRPHKHFDLTDHFLSFYQAFEETPELLDQELFGLDEVSLGEGWQALDGECGSFNRIEVVLFGLSFPADQIVAAVVLDFTCDEVSSDRNSFLRMLLEACVESRLRLRGRSIAQIVDQLAENVEAVPEGAADPDEEDRSGTRERHALVMVQGKGLEPPDNSVVAGILYGIQPPYREEFVTLLRPESLNRQANASAAVTPATSFLYGQEAVVENSVLLTTVQAVGTAARFQRIWRDAYYHVHQFQANRLARKIGVQTRKDLETLADELGNLELDLAFSVQTAADMGLGSTIAIVDDFHADLHEAMQIKARASTVSQMFVRLSGSLRSELTAIESREKEADERYRLRGTITLGVLSFILAPLGILLAFFGINASQVDDRASIFDLHLYLPVYLIVGGIITLALMLAAIGPAIQQWSRLRRQRPN